MSFRIRQIDRTADGREIVRERVADKDRLTLGRNAGSDLHLPDLAVDPDHAEIVLVAPGRVEVRATGSLGFTLDGAIRQTASVLVREGAELGFGSYRVTLGDAGDGTPVLTVNQVIDEEHGDTEGFSVASVMPGRRKLGWIMVTAILALFLLLPIFTHVIHGADKNSRVIGDSSWSPGKLSRAHHNLEAKCETCHVKGFVAVRDETCRTCHKDSHDHAPADRIAAAQANPGLGKAFLRMVSGAFNRPGPGACVDCHVEHQGGGDMALPQQKFCADCHADLKSNLADTRLGNASDFGTAHPEFAPMVVTNADARLRTRVSLASHPREDNGLTFPHKLHLDARGGVARMAVELGAGAGYGKPLACANCHRRSEDGVRFQPIEMERDCGACHSLAYDKVGSTLRTLHHGDVAQALADLSTYRGAVPLTGRQRPGEFGTGGLYHATFGAPLPVPMAAFDRKGVCGSCHTAENRDGRLTVKRVTLQSRFMDHGWFDHAAHKQTACTSCHAADKSSSSADLLLPDLASCRTCHVGEDVSAKGKTPSGCAMCHTYHPPVQVSDKARLNRKRTPGA